MERDTSARRTSAPIQSAGAPSPRLRGKGCGEGAQAARDRDTRHSPHHSAAAAPFAREEAVHMSGLPLAGGGGWRRLVATLALTIMLVPVVSAAQGARIQLPDFSRLAEKASETVDISLDSSLLGLAGRFMDADDEEEKAIKEMLTNLRGVYVRAFEFDADGAYSRTDLDDIRMQFRAPGWNRLVGVRSRRDRTDVDVYVWMDGKKPGGVAILATEPRKLTIVNIVGAVDLERLRNLEGEFGIPRLDLERKPKEEE